jgi:addiction module HigA family antidote
MTGLLPADTDHPNSGQPETQQPDSAQPTTGQPTTSQPTTAQPTTAQPTTSQPTTGQPDPDPNPPLPVHPGTILAAELAARGLTANALALRLRVPANRITDIVRGRRAITPETALRIARYFGTAARSWLELQLAYDLAITERQLGTIIERDVDPA